MKINLFEPYIDEAEEKAVLETLRSKFWASGAGIGNVAKFENKFKKYVNADECLAVNSGTAALNIALSLFNIKNCEVIIPSLSFVSTANCVLQNGGIPKFVDIDKKTLCLKPELIEKAITKKTKAIIPVHFGGFPCDMKKILSLSKKHDLKIIEDAAHATGASFSKKKIGSHGFAVCFSFHPVKNLGMPTGGMIAINHSNAKQFKNKIEARRWCGITNRNDDRYEVEEIGDNYYMNEISAAVGLKQLQKLNKMNSIRKNIAKNYEKNLEVNIKMPFSQNCAYHLFWICVKNRKLFRQKMSEKGIQTGTHYKPIHTFSLYKNKVKLPITEEVGKQIVTLPMHPNLSENDIDKIIKFTNSFAN
ncbi:MAG: glutamine--scyllo-inositol aminotransferase [Chloroflexi bacterium]|nr:glutamine--scyllo-inositol aminotransferase [Chloroflexota bacterium]|tara:strand:- start:1072 stop:2154 length:1083 start_codon:yes stop_codon:yes gene_type:complete